MKIEAQKSFERSVTMYQSTRRDIPGEFNLDALGLTNRGPTLAYK
jgi:hypothetical protein